jgi:hypothetical protein
MQLQGRYLGLMHKVPKAELEKFKAMIPKVGKAEVVERMQAYVRKHETKGGDGPFPGKSVGARKRAKAKRK